MVSRSDPLAVALFALTPLAIRYRTRDLSLTALSTLVTLERTGPRRLTDLAASEGVTQPSMTAVVAQLVDAGYAERRRDPGDGRVVLVAVTRAGSRHLAAARRSGASVFAGLIERLPEADVAALTAALPALRRLEEVAADCDADDLRLPARRTA